ncbi:MAG: hypothetical protein WBD13_09895, partial [Burkholderiaceae bacterium]
GGTDGGGTDGGGTDGGGTDVSWPNGSELFDITNGPFDAIDTTGVRVVKKAGMHAKFQLTDTTILHLQTGKTYLGENYSFAISNLEGPELLPAKALHGVSYTLGNIVDLNGGSVAEFFSIDADSEFPSGSILVFADRVDTIDNRGQRTSALVRAILVNRTAYNHLIR